MSTNEGEYDDVITIRSLERAQLATYIHAPVASKRPL